jgi:hypothetical protein
MYECSIVAEMEHDVRWINGMVILASSVVSISFVFWMTESGFGTKLATSLVEKGKYNISSFFS